MRAMSSQIVVVAIAILAFITGCRSSAPVPSPATQPATLDSAGAESELSLVQLQLEPMYSQYAAGEPVEVRVILLNPSHSSIGFSYSHPGYDYQFEVTRHLETMPWIESVPLTQLGRRVTSEDQFASWSGKVLAPGDHLEFVLVLSRLYDFSMPGQYQVTISRRVSINYNTRLVGGGATIRVSDREWYSGPNFFH